MKAVYQFLEWPGKPVTAKVLIKFLPKKSWLKKAKSIS